MPQAHWTEKHPDFPYFRSLGLENVRCFGEQQTMEFLDESGDVARWTVILGENGTGKTTVLKALASILFSQRKWFGRRGWGEFFDSSYFIRGNPNLLSSVLPGRFPLADIQFGSRDFKYRKDTFQTSLLAGGFFIEGSDDHQDKIDVFKDRIDIYAFGASRRVGNSGISEEQSFPASSLFVDDASLVNAEEWLVQSEYLGLKDPRFAGRFEKVKSLLLRLFRGEIEDIKIETEHRGRIAVLFKTDYGWVDLHNLSLGYKTLVAWMTDFARGLFQRYPDSPDPLAEPAILLVDEIDLHLHPKFQRDLMGFLSESFPATQFIVTAHSPLIVQGAADANVVLLKKSGDQVVVENNPELVRSWRIDQVLTSDLFGLESTRPPEIEEKMRRRRAILTKTQPTEKELATAKSIESELGLLPAVESPEALEALQILQEASAVYHPKKNGEHGAD